MNRVDRIINKVPHWSIYVILALIIAILFCIYAWFIFGGE